MHRAEIMRKNVVFENIDFSCEIRVFFSRRISAAPRELMQESIKVAHEKR